MLKCVLFVFLMLLCIRIEGKLSSFVKVCKRNDPDLNNCFARAIEHALPYVKQFIPKSQMPSVIESVTVAPGALNIVNVTQKLRNVVAYNLINSRINKTELTLGREEHKAVIYLYNSLFEVEADYEFDGKILSVPVFGKGKANIKAYDVQIVITYGGKPYMKNNETYVKINYFKAEINAGKVIYRLGKLFDDNKKLGDKFHKLINENWKKVFSDTKEQYAEILSNFFKNVFSAVYDSVPYDQLFPL